MGLWQRSMIALARSPRLTAAMHGSRIMRRFSAQFVAGQDAAAAVARARELHGAGLAASLFYLGEYVDRPELFERLSPSPRGTS